MACRITERKKKKKKRKELERNEAHAVVLLNIILI